MSVKINSFGGIATWFLRKRFSGLTSSIMLSVTARYYKKSIDQYIQWFHAQITPPLFYNVMIATINRCNGTCSFCPANVHDEKRPFQKMDKETYLLIMEELKNIHWKGKIYLNVNNEPLIDVRISEFAKTARKYLPNAQIALISNGTLKKKKKIYELSNSGVNELVINDYGSSYRLSKNIKEIYKDIRKNATRYKNISITINRRYSKEILATRAGSAPNKPRKNNHVNESCIYPYTDIVIFPSGKIGLCCNDCYEITDYGKISEKSLVDIWRGQELQQIRFAMKGGRMSLGFCQECDVVDAGGRERYIKSMINKIK